MEHSPTTVDQWASNIGITTCTLREQWDKLGIPPKSVLFIWTLFNAAVDFYFEKAFSRITDQANEKKPALFKKLHDTYYFKRCYWLDIIKGAGRSGYETSIFSTVTVSTCRRNPEALIMTTA